MRLGGWGGSRKILLYLTKWGGGVKKSLKTPHAIYGIPLTKGTFEKGPYFDSPSSIKLVAKTDNRTI